MTEQAEAAARNSAPEGSLFVWARWMLFVGLALSSLLTVRISGALLVGDLFLIGSAAVLAISRQPRDQERPRLSDARWVAVWLICLGGLLAGFRSQDLASNLAIVARLIYLVGVLPWQLQRLLNTEKRMAAAAYTWAAGAAVCAAGTLIQFVAGGDIIPGGSIQSGRYSGFTGHVSDTGGITAAACAFAIVGLAAASTMRTRWACALVLTVSAIGLLLSGSVSGMLSVAVVAACLLLLRWLSLKQLALGCIAIFAVLQIVSVVQADTPYALTPIERILQTTGQEQFVPGTKRLDTSSTRFAANDAAIKAFLSNPLAGAGLDEKSAVVHGGIIALQPHNLIVGAAYRGGLFVLIGLLIPIVQALARSWHRRREPGLSRQITAAVLAALVFAMTAPSLYNRYFWIPVAFALAMPLTSRKEREVKGSQRPAFAAR